MFIVTFTSVVLVGLLVQLGSALYRNEIKRDQKTSGQRMESFGEVPAGSYKASDVIACDDLLIETHDIT